jgi:hypothetical protein
MAGHAPLSPPAGDHPPERGPDGGGRPWASGTPSRRAVLLALAATLLGPRPARAAVESRRAAFTCRTSLLHGILAFEVWGTIEESIDRSGGRFEVRIAGQGPETTVELVSRGALREGRWVPLHFQDRLVVYGRQSRLDVRYDHDRRLVEYHGRSETFLLRRLRVADDRLSIPDGLHLDDVVSAALNHAEGRWAPGPDGTLATHVVRRQRRAREGPDDVRGDYRAELVPFVLRVAADGASGQLTAALDLTRFSSWARDDEPARIVFGADRRPEAIHASLILGTTIAIRIALAPP